ncbi:MAG: hypothetical protein Q8760_02595 [Candidatus Phytoplasma australasiaticum]|nr:hypothetical protein [Candidatus Phytoplasma australasiaticum]
MFISIGYWLDNTIFRHILAPIEVIARPVSEVAETDSPESTNIN